MQHELNLNDFPSEIIVHIFTHLSVEDRLLNAALVCKRWQKLTRVPGVWNFIDPVYKPRLPLTVQYVRKRLELSSSIRYIRLSTLYLKDDSIISDIGKQEKLISLILRGGKISPDAYQSIANCKLLQKLDLSSANLNDESLTKIAESCSNLIYLDIQNCIEITTIGILPVVQNCTRLKYLNIESCEKITDDFLSALTNSTQLETVLMTGITFTSTGRKYYRKIAQFCPNLSVLTMEGCSEVTTGDLLPVIQKCTKLKSLNISGGIKLTEEFMIALTAALSEKMNISSEGLAHIGKLPKLTKLELMHIHCVTNNVVSRLSNLTFLNLEGCHSVTNDGVVEYIRNNPQIQFLFLSECLIDDTVLELISKSPCRFNLKHLAVFDCQITQAGIEQIPPSCPDLHDFDFSDNVVDKETVKRWSSEYPKLNLCIM